MLTETEIRRNMRRCAEAQRTNTTAKTYRMSDMSVAIQTAEQGENR